LINLQHHRFDRRRRDLPTQFCLHRQVSGQLVKLVDLEELLAGRFPQRHQVSAPKVLSTSTELISKFYLFYARLFYLIALVCRHLFLKLYVP
jgi:hypothetical protein